MMFRLHFETDNAAFDGENKHPETARILRAIADDIEAGRRIRNISDPNGNRIGVFALSAS